MTKNMYRIFNTGYKQYKLNVWTGYLQQNLLTEDANTASPDAFSGHLHGIQNILSVDGKIKQVGGLYLRNWTPSLRVVFHAVFLTVKWYVL